MPPPIDKLPVELLTRCFLILAEDYVPKLLAKHPRMQVQCGWIVITHVCHRWRAIALDAASLWVTPTWDLGPRWAAEMISRSKSAPLTIRFHSASGWSLPTWENPQSVYRAVLDTIDRHLGRIKVIHIFGGIPQRIHFPVMDTFNKPAPVLQELDLDIIDLCLPENFLGNRPSCLRTLRLESVGHNWTSSLFSELTELAITGGSNGRLPSYDGFYDMLNRNLRLEFLSLTECLPSSSASYTTHSLHRRFDLPYLTKLYIWDTVHVCTHVLHAIGSSPDVVIEISIDLYGKEACNKDISNVFSALSTHMNRRADPYSSLFLDPFHGDSNTTFSLARHATSATHSIDSPRHYSGLDGPTLEECLSVEIVRDPDVEGGNMPDAPLIMELAFSSSVPIVDKIDTVAVAEFASEDILDWDIWRTLRQLYNVRYLRTSSFEAVRHLHSPFFPEIDFDDPETGPTRAPRYLYFTRLTHLELYNVDFTEDDPAMDGKLVGMLEYRKGLRSPLSQVTLTRCIMPDGMAERVKRMHRGVEVQVSDSVLGRWSVDSWGRL